jgi:hypothetical protein
MLLFLTLLTFLSFQDTTGYDVLSEKIYQRNLKSPLRYKVDIDVLSNQLYIYDQKDGKIYIKKNDEVVLIDSLNRKYIDDTILYHDEIYNRLIFTDAGGGRVFEYRFEDKKLNRLDISYRFRTFYGGLYYYDFSNKIYLFGGGGEFTARNNLIEFNNQSNKEWIEVPISNKPSVNSFNFSFHLDENSKSFLLVSYSYDEILSVYKASMYNNNRQWTLVDNFKIDKKDARGTFTTNSFSNKNRIDEKLNILGNYFYDITSGELMKWVVDDEIYGVFKSKMDSVIVLNTNHSKADMLPLDPYDISLITYNSTDFFENETFEIIPSIRQQRIKLGLIVFVVLIFFLIAAVLYRKQSTKPQSANYSEPSFNVISSDNHIVVHIGSNTHYFYEDLEMKILTLIFEVTQKGLDTIDLDLFDEKIFNGLGHKSHMTTKRNDAFKRINNTLGFEFIRKEKSQEDKRRKLIKISLN